MVKLFPFGFYNLPQDNGVESDLNSFLDIEEKNLVLFENDSSFDVVNNVVREKHPFILKGEIKKTTMTLLLLTPSLKM